MKCQDKKEQKYEKATTRPQNALPPRRPLSRVAGARRTACHPQIPPLQARNSGLKTARSAVRAPLQPDRAPVQPVTAPGCQFPLPGLHAPRPRFPLSLPSMPPPLPSAQPALPSSQTALLTAQTALLTRQTALSGAPVRNPGISPASWECGQNSGIDGSNRA